MGDDLHRHPEHSAIGGTGIDYRGEENRLFSRSRPEHWLNWKQRMVAGTAEARPLYQNAVPSCSPWVGLTLLSMSRMMVHLRRMAVMNLVDPHPVHVDQGFNVLSRWPIAPSRSVPSGWWKRPVFRWPCRQQSSCMAGNASQTVGVVHIVIAAKAPENGLAKLTPSCRAIRSCRYGNSWKTPFWPSQSGFDRHRQALGRRGNPASEVILEPWNSSFNRRSKTTRRHPGFNSPIGCAISAAPCMQQLHDSYSRIAFSPH